MMYKSIKGQTRAFRKACRKHGMVFPKHGAFHVTQEDGIAVRPDHLYKFSVDDLTVVSGPGPSVQEAAPVAVQHEPLPFVKPDSVALPEVFRKVVSEGMCNGVAKKRTNYRPVKNPKSGENYHIKTEVNGKGKWVEVTYSDLLKKNEAAA